MSNFIFLFDLDAIIVKQEIFSVIADAVGKNGEMSELSKATEKGGIPFKKSFLEKVELLRDVSVSKMQNIVENIKLNEEVVKFIAQNQNRCYIVTEHLDVWISGLLKRMKMENNVFCSKAYVVEDKIKDVISVIDKNSIISQMLLPFVAVGNGDNDAEMIEAAAVGIGYGGVRETAVSVLDCASHMIYREDRLAGFLKKLL